MCGLECGCGGVACQTERSLYVGGLLFIFLARLTLFSRPRSAHELRLAQTGVFSLLTLLYFVAAVPQPKGKAQ